MITPALLREWAACLPDDRIAAAFAGRAEVSPRDVAADGTVPLADRLWVLCRCLAYVDEGAARLFAIESALRVAHLAGDEYDQAQYCGLMSQLLEIEDLPDDSRAATRRAARAAIMAAARCAAETAVRGAVAVTVAVWVAAADAAVDDARAAVHAADAAAAVAWAADATAASSDDTAASSAAVQRAIDRALEWLGDLADGWEP